MIISHSIKMKYKDAWNLSIILVIWCQNILLVHVSAENEKAALVFHRFDGTLIEMPSDLPSDAQCNSWASACSAENDGDEKFIASTAFNKNSVFVKTTCSKEKTIEEAKFQTNICKNSFQISALFNKQNKAFDFGYEVYYGAENEHLFRTYDIEKYFSAENVFTALNNTILQRSKSVFEKIIRDFNEVAPPYDSDDFWYNKDRKLRFMWINLFNIKFDPVEWTPRRITYRIDDHNKWPTTWSCQSYDLVAEAYDKVNLDYLYSEENQNEIFSDLQLPEKTSDAACGSTCLTKWLLIPADHFNFGSEEDSVCPNMATVPIWTSTIKEVMIKVEKFLFALSQVAGKYLHVISGVTGQLQLPRKNWSILSLKLPKAKVFLDSKNEKPGIPAPNILYKLVQYRSSNCLKSDWCWYLATIIIHNDPNFDPEKDKICEDVTSSWGWSELTLITAQTPESTLQQSPFIYVCRTTSGLIKNFMEYLPKEALYYEDLNLNNFPFYDDQQNVERNSIVDRVRETFTKFSNLERENNNNRLPLSDVSIENLQKDEEFAPILDILSEDIQESAKEDEDKDKSSDSSSQSEVGGQYKETLELMAKKHKNEDLTQ